MASTAPTFPIPRRSASLPVQKPSGADPQTEVLYTLPSARIVQFQTTGPSSKRTISSGDSPLVEDEAGTLSWVSRFERTIAVGPFRIYRAPGSVAFLNCQNALRPILPKSQCWVVDDDSSKFVLQVKRPQYWRIEVPNKTPEDRRRTEELKEVLGKVLLFEKTPCPFQRSFYVDLPEAPTTPVKKRPWKPVDRPKLEHASTGSSLGRVREDAAASLSRRFSSPAVILEEGIEDSSPLRPMTSDAIPKSSMKVSIFECTGTEEVQHTSRIVGDDVTEAEERSDFEEPMKLSESTASLSPALEPSMLEEESVFADFTGLEEDSYSDATDDTNVTPKSRLPRAYQPKNFQSDQDDRLQRPLKHCSRSITAPPLLSLVTSPPSKNRSTSPSDSRNIDSDSGFSSSVESFHTVQSWHSPLAPPSPPSSDPPSPTSHYPYPHNNIVLPKRHARHSREISELTVTPDTTHSDTLSKPSAPRRSQSLSRPQTPTLSHNTEPPESEFQISTPPTIRHRATTSSNSRRRELSPLPAAVNLFSPQRRRSRHLRTARHLPTAIVQKTCEILLSPPSHLLHLMLSIASKIAAGEWRGVLTGHGESVHWDFEDEYRDDGWGEDDFGISLSASKRKPQPKSTSKGQARKNGDSGGSWEVD